MELPSGFWVVVSLIVYAVVFGALGSWVARQCGRSIEEGCWLGVLFGPFGVIIEALLPKYPWEKYNPSREHWDEAAADKWRKTH